MLKISAKYAAICSIFLVIIYHVSDYFGIHPLINVSHLVFDLIIFGLFIFFCLKDFKSQQDNEILHFWQGMTLGFNVYVISTVIFSAYLMLLMQMDVDVLADYKEAASKFLLEKKDLYAERLGEESFNQKLEDIVKTTAGELLTSTGLKKIIAGFFITPVIAIILRKQPK